MSSFLLMLITLSLVPFATSATGATNLHRQYTSEHIKDSLKTDEFRVVLPQEDLRTAVMKGDVKMTRWLLDSGVDTNAKDGLGWSPLFYAVLHKQEEITRLLLKANADPNLQDENGLTALMIACNYENLVAVKELLSYGAAPSARTKSGDTPIIFAAEGRFIEVVQRLLDQGAQVQEANLQGVTPLMRSSHFLTQMLIDAGAEIDKTDIFGNTALFYAIDFSDIKKIQVLIRKGANVNLKNKKGITALELAIKEGKKSIENMLRQAGAY